MELKSYQYINVLKNKVMVLLKNIFFYLLFLTLAITQIYDFSDTPSEDESFSTANFRIFISENIDTIRGIYAYMHGFGGDSRSIVQDTLMQELSESISFALLGVQLDNMYMDSGIGNSLIDAKIDFAIQSNHEELIYSPIFFDGYSWGGQWSYHYTKWNPQDVIAFMTMKGGYHDTTYSESAINVPGYMFIGEYDSDYRIQNLTDIFLKHRASGALWTLAMEPNSGHNRISDRELLNSFLFDMIDKRLPETFNINEPVLLNSLIENNGYLGNRTTFEIFNHNCYNFGTDSLSWISNIDNAQKWQFFVSENSSNLVIDFCYLGDINYDNSLSILDILLILDIIIEYRYNTYADMNYNQSVNIQDIIILLQLIL
tara:strand:- start:173 stop:1288 length:1116 start_codon:yes stop_codon:yes gene_type:complete